MATELNSVSSALEALRFLMEDELAASNKYEILRQYLNEEEQKIIDHIISDETVHFEQLRQLFIKRQKGYKAGIFDVAINENKGLLAAAK